MVAYFSIAQHDMSTTVAQGLLAALAAWLQGWQYQSVSQSSTLVHTQMFQWIDMKSCAEIHGPEWMNSCPFIQRHQSVDIFSFLVKCHDK